MQNTQEFFFIEYFYWLFLSNVANLEEKNSFLQEFLDFFMLLNVRNKEHHLVVIAWY